VSIFERYTKVYIGVFLYTALMHFSFYAHPWGLLIPSKNSFHWEQQTDGVMCHHVTLEGVFVPLDEPSEWDKEEKERIELLDELQHANYTYNEEKVADIWKRIHEAVKRDFEFEEVDAPKGQPENAEGLQWVKITKGSDEFDWKNFKDLEGKVVCLVFPNCD